MGNVSLIEGDFSMAKGPQAASWTRGDFIKTAGLFGGMAGG
jgi:hypothetical protein